MEQLAAYTEAKEEKTYTQIWVLGRLGKTLALRQISLHIDFICALSVKCGGGHFCHFNIFSSLKLCTKAEIFS